MVAVVDLVGVKFALEIVQLVGVRLFGQDRRAIVRGESLFDDVGVVHEVQYCHIVFLRMRTIEPRERLNCFYPGKWLVDVHGVEERFVVARLELVGAHKKPIRVFLNLVGDLPARKIV